MVDNLTKEQRRFCMSRVRGTDTALERAVRAELFRRGYRFRKNVRALPGKPDVVFLRHRVAVFIDGDFWHGYKFGSWRAKLTPGWQKKIEQNLMRDTQNRRRLRRMGWKVVRLWGHEVEADLARCVEKIERAINE